MIIIVVYISLLFSAGVLINYYGYRGLYNYRARRGNNRRTWCSYRGM